MKNQEKSALIPLIRRDLQANFTPYSSAASEMGKIDGAHYLNANENPYPFSGLEGYERYDVQQPPALIDALAKNYGTKKEYIVATRGSDESIDLMIRMFCESGKDTILTCPPTFGMYKVYGSLQGAPDIQVPLLQNGMEFSLDIEGIIATVKDKTKNVKMVFLCNPNSPTGNLFLPQDIEQILRELEGHAAVIVDEAYINFAKQESFVEKLEQFPNLIVLRTLSKVHALAGERLGCAISADTTFTTFMRGCLAPYPLAKSVSKNAVEALKQAEEKQDEMIANIIKGRQELEENFRKCSDVEYVYPSETNFILVKFKSYDTAQNFLKLAASKNIILRDISGKEDTKNCLRISVGTEEENEMLTTLVESMAKAA